MIIVIIGTIITPSTAVSRCDGGLRLPLLPIDNGRTTTRSKPEDQRLMPPPLLP
jgi:hypothetical protein